MMSDITGLSCTNEHRRETLSSYGFDIIKEKETMQGKITFKIYKLTPPPKVRVAINVI